ncbi:MAG: site-specific integrase, partial [Chloroflexi bacterium]|nr:site-specific integrase [Chloroflexota bacterium]
MTPININAVVAQLQALEPRHQEIIAELTKALAATTQTKISMPLPTWIDPWCQHLTNKGRSPHTVRNYAQLTRPFVTAFPCPTPIDLDTWLTLRRNKVSPSTLCNFAAGLRNFFGYLAERGIPAMTPKDVPVITAIRKRRKAPPPEDVA